MKLENLRIGENKTKMLTVYVILFLTTSDGYDISNTLNDITDTEEKVTNTTDRTSNSDEFSGLEDIRVREYRNLNVSLDKLFAFVLNISKLQLRNVHRNIKRDYPLNTTELLKIDNSFQNCDWQYELTLKKYFKKSFSDTTSKLSVSDLIDFSQFLLQKNIENNLQFVESKLLFPLIPSKQSFLVNKILRQQMKIVTNIIDNQICWDLTLCMKKYVYTDYLVEWVRFLLNADSNELNAFFKIIPTLIDTYMHLVRTNVRYRHKIKHIVQSDDLARRDFLDFIDEIFTNQDEIILVMPSEIKKSTILYLELFELIDNNYNLNIENKNRLEDISKMLMKWTLNEKVKIQDILENIVQNIEVNLKIWPLNEQSRINYVWSQILIT